MSPKRCKAKTKKGKRCRSTSLIGAYCFAHQPKEVRDKQGFGGAQPGAGRPRLPRPHERMREKIEAELDAIVAPYFETIKEAVMFVKYEGELIVTDTPDLGARIAAAERLLDRVYGKPAQAVELTGAAGGAVAVEVMAVDDFDAGTRKLAHDLLARAAGADSKVR